MRLISGAKQGTGELRDRSCLVKCSARAKTLLQNLHWYEGGVVCCWGGSFICAIATAVSLCLRSFGPIGFPYRGVYSDAVVISFPSVEATQRKNELSPDLAPRNSK